MGMILHVEASPRGEESYSTRVAHDFLAAYQKAHPADWIDTLNVFTDTVPAFDAPAAKAKYAVLAGRVPTGEAEKKWREVMETIDRFMQAEKIVISSPMWNFSIPYRLKQYFDVIVQPGLTFKYVNEQYVGLVTGRPVLLVLACGGHYPRNTPLADFDMQKPYLELILRFIGFDNIHSFLIEGTLQDGPDSARKSAEAASAQARQLAESF